MDNNIFRVNGEYNRYGDTRQIELAVELIMRQKGYKQDNRVRLNGWRKTEKHGLILYWADPHNKEGYNRFPSGLEPKEAVDMIVKWLMSDDSNDVELDKWCSDCDHDGHNGHGFLIYVEDWGHVNGEWEAMFAVKPCYMWYGK